MRLIFGCSKDRRLSAPAAVALLAAALAVTSWTGMAAARANPGSGPGRPVTGGVTRNFPVSRADLRKSAVTYRVHIMNADGLDRRQLADAGRTGVVPKLRPIVKPPVVSFLAKRPATNRAAIAGMANATVYPGMYVPPGTPIHFVDSANYAGGLYPADIYQYMSAGDCQGVVPDGGYYTKNRYSSCAVQQLAATLQECEVGNPTNCTVVGTASWRQTSVGQGNDGDQNAGAANGSRLISYTVAIDQITTTGAGAAFTLALDVTCTAQNGWHCNPNGNTNASAPITTWETPGTSTANFSFVSPTADGDGSDHIVVADGTSTDTVSWTDPTTGQELTATTAPLGMSADFRFDSAGRNPAWPTKWTGRLDGVVFDVVPVISFDGACGTANCNAISQSASHILLAFNNPAGTMPPWTGGGPKPAIPGAMRNPYDWLSRTTDDTRISLNDSITTAVCNIYLPTVPAGSNCDEYPFKSTYQGGGSGGPYSVLRINGNDNQESGRRLGAFYTLQRLLDCNPVTGGLGCDAFGVQAFGTAAPPPYPYVVIDEVGGGAFADEWDATGGAAGTLGTPADAEYAISGGQEQDFTNGDAYWSAGTGTHEVQGALLTDYQTLNGPGLLGFPLSDQQSAPNGGAENLFAGTSCGSSSGSIILWSPSTPASDVYGCLYQAYINNYAGPGGALGYPTANQQPISNGQVIYLSGTTCGSASGSALYWDNSVAHESYGCIYQTYKQLGGPTSALGFPVDDEYSYNSGRRQDFRYGDIVWLNGAATVSYFGPSLTMRSEANGDFVSAELGYSGASYAMLRARATSQGSWESWSQIPMGNNEYALLSNANSHFVSAELGYTGGDYGELRARATTVGPWELFYIITNTDGTYSIQSAANGLYVTAELGYSGATYGELRARSSTIGPWERFTTYTGSIGNGGCVNYGPYATGPDACSGFSTTSVWFSGGGVGLLGQEIWTYANGTVQDSTATYQLSGLSGGVVWQLQAYVPSNHSDASHAHYHYCSPGYGCSDGYVNQNNYMNQWANFGAVCSSDGTATVVLADDGGDAYPAQVGADAIRAVRTNYGC